MYCLSYAWSQGELSLSQRLWVKAGDLIFKYNEISLFQCWICCLRVFLLCFANIKFCFYLKFYTASIFGLYFLCICSSIKAKFFNHDFSGGYEGNRRPRETAYAPNPSYERNAACMTPLSLISDKLSLYLQP